MVTAESKPDQVLTMDRSSPTQNGVSREGAYGDDGRSSSLSEIEDGLVEEHTQVASSIVGDLQNGNDSEAETERLENSPVKSRKRQNVLLSSETSPVLQSSRDQLDGHLARSDSEAEIRKPATVRRSDEESPTREANADPELDPLENPSESGGGPAVGISAAPKIAGQKRKRRRDGGGNLSSAESDSEAEEPLRKRTGSVRADVNGRDAGEDVKVEHSIDDDTAYAGTVPDHVEGHTENPNDAEQGLGAQVETTLDTRTGRKGRRKTSPPPAREITPIGAGLLMREEAHNETVDDDGDTRAGDAETVAEGEDEEEDIDTPAKNEEGMVKKSAAMDSLSQIERNFATFRDKLYDERLAQLSNELVLLTKPNPTHPEYLGKLQCIDQRRDEKIRLERTLYHYRTKALQVKSVAARSQIHSQYYQTARTIRETKLEEAGEQWYQIYRDRQRLEGSVPDYTYKFPTRRSQQVAQQTAYNMEVSILSGIAKYVGFPAAPNIDGVRSSELDADLQLMGHESSL